MASSWRFPSAARVGARGRDRVRIDGRIGGRSDRSGGATRAARDEAPDAAHARQDGAAGEAAREARRQGAKPESASGAGRGAGRRPPTRSASREQVAEDVARRIQPQLAAANKTFVSQFNPAIGFIVDDVFSYREHERANNEWRSGEIGVSASVDPFARAYAILNGTNDGVEVEEAAIVTTSLPYNLAVKGGRFFADFGRLSKFHDHDLPFVIPHQPARAGPAGPGDHGGVEFHFQLPARPHRRHLRPFPHQAGGGGDFPRDTQHRPS